MIKPVLFVSACLGAVGSACSDFIMGFSSPGLTMSGRTMDLGSTTNWTITSWPVNNAEALPDPDGLQGARYTSKYGTVGITGESYSLLSKCPSHFLFC